MKKVISHQIKGDRKVDCRQRSPVTKKEPDSEEGYEASSEKGDPKDEIEEERQKIEAAK